MRKIKANRIPKGYVEWRELFDAFQIFRALTFSECESGHTVIRLLDNFLLKYCLRFRLVFEELPIAAFPHCRPSHTVEWLSVNLNFGELCFSRFHIF